MLQAKTGLLLLPADYISAVFVLCLFYALPVGEKSLSILNWIFNLISIKSNFTQWEQETMLEGKVAVEVIADYRWRLCDGKMGNYAKWLGWREGRFFYYKFTMKDDSRKNFFQINF